MIGDVVFLHGAHQPRCSAEVDQVFGYHGLQVMTSGAVDLSYDQHRYAMRGPWIWPCHPGPRIRFRAARPGRTWHHRYMAFTGPRVAAWEADGIWPRRPEPLAEDAARHLAGLLDRLVQLVLEPGHWARMRAVNLLELILLEWAETSGAAAPEQPPWLAAVLAELGAPRAEPDYAALAAAHAMSLSTLRRRFREATGTTLHAYHLGCRAAEARRLLGGTDEPVKAIADRLGYRDVFYFTRQFTRFTGVSPAAYRRTRQSRPPATGPEPDGP